MMGPFTGQPTTIVSTDSSGSYVFNGSTSSPMPHTCPPKNWPAERLSVYKWEVGMLSAIFALAMVSEIYFQYKRGMHGETLWKGS